MIIILFFLLSMAAGVFLYTAWQKHGSGLAAGLSRFSSPYNALVTFALAVLFFMFGHNPLPSALGGGFLVVGVCCVVGHIWRTLVAVRSHLSGRVSVPFIRRQKRGDTYWEFIDGEWVEIDRIPEASAGLPR